MPLVMNTRDDSIVIKAFGNWYEWKPMQVKFIYENELAHWLVKERNYEGLVGLPEELEEYNVRKYPQNQNTLPPEAKSKIQDAIKAGRAAYCAHLRTVIYNLQVSLRQDLEQANIKADPKVFASPGEIKAMEELVRYQSLGDDAEQAKIEHLKELEKKIKAVA